MSEREIQKIEVLAQVLDGSLRTATAARVLRLSQRQVQRLVRKVQDKGGVSLTLCIRTGPCGFRYSSVEALAEHYGELIAGRKPFSDIATVFLEPSNGEIDQLGRSLVGRE